jgi:hypothetical protein
MIVRLDRFGPALYLTDRQLLSLCRLEADLRRWRNR